MNVLQHKNKNQIHKKRFNLLNTLYLTFIKQFFVYQKEFKQTK